MDGIVKIVIWLNLVFAFTVLAIFYLKGSEPVVLVEYWFKAFTAELLAMAAIQIAKERKGGENNANN